MVATMFPFRSFIREDSLTEMRTKPIDRSKHGSGKPSTHSKRLKASRKASRR